MFFLWRRSKSNSRWVFHHHIVYCCFPLLRLLSAYQYPWPLFIYNIFLHHHMLLRVFPLRNHEVFCLINYRMSVLLLHVFEKLIYFFFYCCTFVLFFLVFKSKWTIMLNNWWFWLDILWWFWEDTFEAQKYWAFYCTILK